MAIAETNHGGEVSPHGRFCADCGRFFFHLPNCPRAFVKVPRTEYEALVADAALMRAR